MCIVCVIDTSLDSSQTGSIWAYISIFCENYWKISIDQDKPWQTDRSCKLTQRSSPAKAVGHSTGFLKRWIGLPVGPWFFGFPPLATLSQSCKQTTKPNQWQFCTVPLLQHTVQDLSGKMHHVAWTTLIIRFMKRHELSWYNMICLILQPWAPVDPAKCSEWWAKGPSRYDSASCNCKKKEERQFKAIATCRQHHTPLNKLCDSTVAQGMFLGHVGGIEYCTVMRMFSRSYPKFGYTWRNAVFQQKVQVHFMQCAEYDPSGTKHQKCPTEQTYAMKYTYLSHYFSSTPLAFIHTALVPMAYDTLQWHMAPWNMSPRPFSTLQEPSNVNLYVHGSCSKLQAADSFWGTWYWWADANQPVPKIGSRRCIKETLHTRHFKCKYLIIEN